MHTPSTIHHTFKDSRYPSHLKAVATAIGITSGLFLLIALMSQTDPISIPPIIADPPYITTTRIPILIELPTPTDTPDPISITNPPATPLAPPPIRPMTIDIETIQVSNPNWTVPNVGYLLPNQGSQIIDTTMLDSIPRIIVQIAPRIPKSLSLGKSITVEFQVNPSGNVTTVKIINSDDVNLNGPTKRALMRWKFEPGMRDGKAVPFRLIQSISFN